jgi:hypothetical protein
MSGSPSSCCIIPELVSVCDVSTEARSSKTSSTVLRAASERSPCPSVRTRCSTNSRKCATDVTSPSGEEAGANAEW